MKKRILSLLVCFVLCLGVVGVIDVKASDIVEVTIKEGDRYELSPIPYFSGQDVEEWSFRWDVSGLNSSCVTIEDLDSGWWPRCLIRAVRRTGSVPMRAVFYYKVWLPAFGMYLEEFVSFRITIKCGHTSLYGEEIKQPSVGVAGEKKVICANCGETIKTTIPALTFAEAFKPNIKSTRAYGKSNTNFVRVSPPAVDIDPTKKSIQIGNNKLYYMEPTGVYVGMIGNITATEAANKLKVVSGASEVIRCGVLSNASGNTPTASDYGIVKRVVLKKTKSLTDKQFMAADVNSDGVINAADYGAIKRVVLKKDSTFKKPQ